ncbi:MAG: NADH-quinone oxidoreductase subunit H [Armatimonadetes bacterium]|nr:NADH-quinone oxidoreductase subunit H [Armatimonadota bacterium]
MTVWLVVGGVVQVGLVLLLAPLFEGLMRKLVRARIHSREGPPIWQPYYDLFKLLVKEDTQPAAGWVYLLPSVLCLASVLTASLLVPLFGRGILGEQGDAILFIYLMAASVAAVVLAGAMSGSPYSSVGFAREIMMTLTVEPVLIMALITAAIDAGSLDLGAMAAWHSAHGPSLSMLIAAFALLLSVQAQVGKLPFDVPEADQEIMGGPFIELSGPKLALFKWAFWAKQLVLAALLVQVFVPWPTFTLGLAGSAALGAALCALVALVKVLVVVVVVAVVDAVNPRLRLDQAMAYFVAVIFVAGIGLILAFVGT